MSFSATPVPNAKKQFCDNNGVPLVGGSVSYYVPGTLTPKTTWVDENQVTPNPTTISLDAGGRAIVFGTGDYREIVKDVNGVTLWDEVTNVPASASALSGTQVVTAGNIASGAWLTSGLRMQLAAATYTDTTSAGTAATMYVDAQKAATVAASSIVTYTNAYTSYVETPLAGTNVTFTNAWAFGADSLKVVGTASLQSLIAIGAAVFSSTLNNVTITAPGGSAATLTIASGKTFICNSSTTLAGVDGKTLTVDNSLEFVGTDATVMTFPTTSATIARTDIGQTFVGTNTFSNATTFSSTINKVTITAPAASATLTIANTKTLTVNDSTTLSTSSITFGNSKVLTVSNSLTLQSSIGDGNSLDIGSGVLVGQANGSVTLSGTAAVVLDMPSAGAYLVRVSDTGGGNGGSCVVSNTGGASTCSIVAQASDNGGIVFSVAYDSGPGKNAVKATATTSRSYNVFWARLC